MIFFVKYRTWKSYSITDDGCVDYESSIGDDEVVEIAGKELECEICKHFEKVTTSFDGNEKIIRQTGENK